jgi:hypothetical protein
LSKKNEPFNNLERKNKMNANTLEPKDFPMPKNEVELIERLRCFKQNENSTTVRTYYALGQMIVAVYKKEYGTEKQQKLVNETGFSKSTLYKCRQFALKFSTEQMDELFQNKFTLPWRVVASNLSLGPDDFIKQYRAANTLDELWNALHNSKKAEGAAQAEKSGKEKKIPRSQLEAKLGEYEKTIILKDEEINELKALNADLVSQKTDLAKKLKIYMAQDAEAENFKMAKTA